MRVGGEEKPGLGSLMFNSQGEKANPAREVEGVGERGGPGAEPTKDCRKGPGSEKPREETVECSHAKIHGDKDKNGQEGEEVSHIDVLLS
jgi:hypothetical protein